MIRKAPLTEAQTALGKQKLRSVERGYMFHYRNSVKNSFPTQKVTKIGQSDANCYAKNDFNMAAVRHLEFFKNSFSVK